MQDFADILHIAGISQNYFNTVGQDVNVVRDDKKIARVFRRDGKIVYRAGSEMDWDGSADEDHPVIILN